MVAFRNTLFIAGFLVLFLPVTAQAQTQTQEPAYSLTTAADPPECASIEGGGKYPAGSRAKTRYYDLADNCRWTGWDVVYYSDKYEPGCDTGVNECYFTMHSNIDVIYLFEVAKSTPIPTVRPKPKATPKPLLRPTPTPTTVPKIRPLPTKPRKPLVKPTLAPTPVPKIRPLPTKPGKPLVKPTLVPKIRPLATETPKVPLKPPRTIKAPPVAASSRDLTVRIDTGLKREPIKLLCSGMSETSSTNTILCQASNTQDKNSLGSALSPNQWPIVVGNKGGSTVTDYIVDIVLSSDLKAPVKYAPPLGPNITEDVLINPGRLDDGPPLGTNSSAVIRVGVGPLPNGVRVGKYGICAIIDPGNLIEETNETNNVFCVPAEISEFSKHEAGFSGTIYVDDTKIVNDATISSYINGEKTDETNVSEGSYSLLIPQPQDKDFEGLPIKFRLSVTNNTGDSAQGILLDQTGYWEAGSISEIDFHLKRTRGFLVNPPLGEFGSRLSWNNIDANLLSIVGILLTLITAGIPLFKSD